jgi:hypothetical protein
MVVLGLLSELCSILDDELLVLSSIVELPLSEVNFGMVWEHTRPVSIQDEGSVVKIVFALQL